MTMGLFDREKWPKVGWELIDKGKGETYRAVDEDAGVVLYLWRQGRAGGLAAVPVADTELRDQ